MSLFSVSDNYYRNDNRSVQEIYYRTNVKGLLSSGMCRSVDSDVSEEPDVSIFTVEVL